jgi:hypothetical protein
MNKTAIRMLAIASVLTSTFLYSCSDDEEMGQPPAKPDISFLMLSEGNKLLKINAKQSDVITNTVSITGLADNDALQAIDFRPATGELYGVSTQNRLYAINSESGKARVIGGSALNPVINGTSVAFDFNPTVDRIRLITNSGQNLRLHPETGAVAATDGVINGINGAVIESAAYINNFSGATSTILYDIDSQTDKLYKQDPPNNGTLVEVGSLGVDISGSAGFDISPDGTVALAAVKIGVTWELHQIDLASGKSLKLGNLPAGNLKGLAIPTSPVAYAIDDANNLVILNFISVGTPITKPVTGLQTGESILGIDFRPANGQLYGIGSSSRIYTLNTASGAATPVGSLPLTTLLSGSSFGFDFNPTVDRIRCVSNTGQNLRLHPETGIIAAIDGMLNPATPMIVSSAYTNNFAGATSTILFNVDAMTNKLTKQDPPNNGTQVEVGSLGIDVEEAGGFDIGSQSGIAYAALKVAGKSSIYTINITTGMATKIADLPAPIRAFTVGTGF